MTLPATETVSEGVHIDARAMPDAAAFLLDGQAAAIDAVRPAIPSILRSAEKLAGALRAGHDIHYAAAGSSGLMALADISELRGTFGIPTKNLHIHMAGGVPVDANMPGETEDTTTTISEISATISGDDVVVVLTASGTTPYALAVAQAARKQGAFVIGIANNPNTPLLDIADEPICIATPSEVIAGSTRLGAGTAQKAALNLMSTLMGVELGHVFRGEMVNVVADNAKLVRRAVGMVSRLAGVSPVEAEAAIAQTQGHLKSAILIAKGSSHESAIQLLEQHQGHLGPCLSSLISNQTTSSR